MASRAGRRRVCKLRPSLGAVLADRRQAYALADPERALSPGAFVFALGALRRESQITDAFRTGAGMGWHEHHEDVFSGCEMSFAQATSPTSPPARSRRWTASRTSSTTAAGWPTSAGPRGVAVLLAQAYPKARILGSDYHQASIDIARKRAADAGVADRARFEVASAQTFSGTGYDLIATFDCLHDMGDPAGAARQIRQAIAVDGTWLIVEPLAGDTLAGNLNPVGRVYYSFSTFVCVPNARSQPGGYALGAQAGEAAIRRVAEQAGFTRFRRAAETPFNAIYEARP